MRCFRDAVDLRLVAQDVDLQVGRVVEKIGIDEQEAADTRPTSCPSASRRRHTPRSDRRRRWRTRTALLIGRRAGADLQHRIGLKEGDRAGNRAHSAPPINCPATVSIGWRVARIFRNASSESLVGRQELAESRSRESHVHRGIRLHHALDLDLIRVHLLGRRAFLRDEHAAHETSCRRSAETPLGTCRTDNRAEQADHPRQGRNPAVPQEEPERSPVNVQHPCSTPPIDALDPVLLRALRRGRRAAARTSAASASARRCRWRKSTR